jgi:hypothetical protein
MSVVIFRRKYVTAACEAFAVQQPFVNEQAVIVSTHIIVVLCVSLTTALHRRD